MQAPTIGGVRVRKGDGETVRLARGASLTIRTAYEEFDVVVTAESFGNPSRPSRNLAFSTRIPGTV